MILYCFHQKLSGLILILSLLNAYLVQSSSTTNQCSNYCSTGGICLRTENGPKCICSPKWTGERCEIPQELNTSQTNRTESRNDPCEYAPPDFCQNGGICYVSNNEYACQCRYPNAGDYCERLSVCVDYCWNNGTCKETAGKPECTCKAGRAGVRCESFITPAPGATTAVVPTTAIPQCELLICYNSGTCVLENNRAKCNCRPTHTGPQCRTPSSGISSQGPSSISPPTITSSTSTGPRKTCAEASCQNGGRCYNTGNSYFCLCDSRYNGKDCENRIQ